MAYKKKNITLLFIPNILSDEGRILKSFPYNRDWTIREYLKKSGFEFKDMYIEVNGNEIKNLSQHLNIGDEIVILFNIEFDPGTWAVIVTVFKIITAVIAVASAAYSIYSAITYQKPKTPSFGTSGGGLDEDSPSSSWDGVRTTANVGTPIPIIYGTRLTGGNVLNEYVSTDGDKNFLYTLLGICQGEADSITLARISRNPAANYSGYALETRLGINTQTVIPDFHDNHNLKSIAIQITKNNAYTYTTEDDDIEAFEIHFQLPSGLWQQDSGGSILSYDVTYKVEYKLHSSETWIDLGSTTISAKSRSSLKRIFRKFGLATGQYDIRITKTSDDSDFTHTSDLYIERIDEISCEDEQEFPNITIAGVKALAMDQLSGSFPDYEFLVRGRKIMIPKVMNGEDIISWDDYYWDPTAECYKLLSDGTVLTWDGETFITAYSANPIWCLYDLMVSKRFGLGNFIASSDHNLDYLVEMSQYCEERVPDGIGSYEKRFRLDICIDSPQKALDLILQLCSIFRGLPFYSDRGQIKIAIEKPDTPVQLFYMGNIVKDSFSETWGSIRDVPNIVNVQFDDEDNNYETTTIQAAVDDEALIAGKPINIKTIRYYGTKLSYAIRHGRNYLKVCKYISNTIKIKSGLGAIVRQCGELIDIAHDVPQWGFSGRVKADFSYKGDYDAETTYAVNDAVSYSGNEYKCIQISTGHLPTDPDYWALISKSKVKLDRTVVIEVSKSYAVRVDFAKGGYEERTVTDPAGSYIEVNVSSAFSKTPLEHDGYSFGELNKIVKPARIISLRRQRNGEVEFETVEYNENIYDDTAVVIPQKKYSSLSADFPNVVNLKLTERLVKMADGTIENAIDIWFDKPDMTSYMVLSFAKARIYLSDNNGLSWNYIGETSGRHFPIIGNLKDLHSYKVAVVSVSALGQEKPIAGSPQEEINVLGKTASPSNVTGFEVYQEGNLLKFSWNAISDVDLARYIIKQGSEWNTGTVIGEKVDVTEFIYPVGGIGNLTFMIKAIDTSGNESVSPAIDEIQVIPPPDMNFVNVFDRWSKPLEFKLSNLELVQANYHNSGYVRPCLALKTAITWEEREAESKTWEQQETDGGLILDALFESSGYAEMIEPLDLETIFEFKLVIDADYKNAANGNLTIQISYSEDGITYTSFADIDANVSYRARYLKFKIIIAISNTTYNLYLYDLSIYIKAPVTKVAWGKDVLIPIAGKTLTFGVGFTLPPRLKGDIVNGIVGVVIFNNKTKDDALAKVYDMAGSAIGTAEIDWEGRGY